MIGYLNRYKTLFVCKIRHGLLEYTLQNGHRDGQLTAGNGILSVIKSVTGNAIREHLDSQNFDIPLVSFFKGKL